MRKNFANLSLEKLAHLIGLEMTNRKGALQKMENATHFLTAQIHLYVLLHFYADSSDGSVSGLSVAQLAKELKKDAKTVRKSLRMLNEAGLISMPVYDEDGELSLSILNIQDMYQLRGKGGHGYITCNGEMLDSVLQAQTINELRTVIGGLIICTSSEMNASAKNINRYDISMKDLRKSFPASSRPVDVAVAVSEQSAFGSIFERLTENKKRSICVRLKETLRASRIKSQLRLDAKAAIHTELTDLTNIIREINTAIHEEGFIPVSGMRNLLHHGITIDDKVSLVDTRTALPMVDLTSNVVNDCCTIAQDLGIDTVIKAIRHFYTEYRLSGSFKQDKKKSLGALLRRIAEGLLTTTTATTSLA